MKGACQKCGGLLIVERAMDYYAQSAGVKCVNCGWSKRESLVLFASPEGSRGVSFHMTDGCKGAMR